MKYFTVKNFKFYFKILHTNLLTKNKDKKPCRLNLTRFWSKHAPKWQHLLGKLKGVVKQSPCMCRAKRYVGTCNSYSYSIYLNECSTCRYVRLKALNVLNVHGPRFNAPKLNCNILATIIEWWTFYRKIKHLNLSAKEGKTKKLKVLVGAQWKKMR